MNRSWHDPGHPSLTHSSTEGNLYRQDNTLDITEICYTNMVDL